MHSNVPQHLQCHLPPLDEEPRRVLDRPIPLGDRASQKVPPAEVVEDILGDSVACTPTCVDVTGKIDF